MVKRYPYILLLFSLVLFSSLRVAGQMSMPDYVCMGETKTYTVDSHPGSTYEWSIDGTVVQTGLSNQFMHTWNTANTYTIQVQEGSSAGCMGEPRSGLVYVSTLPELPIVSVIQPTCSVSTGTINISSPRGTGMTYSINGADYTNTTGIFTLLTANTYFVTARASGGCISSQTSVTINPYPTAPAAPTASVTVQPTCDVATGTIVVTVPTGAFEYSLDGSAYQSSTIFSLVAPGTHNVTTRSTSDITCESTATLLTVNDAPATPSAPVASATSQPTCTMATGTIYSYSPI